VAGKVQRFFGDDWDDALDSIAAAPGALGGLMLSCLRQVRAVDAAAFAIVVAGWASLAAGAALGETQWWHFAVAVVPTILWLAAGIAGVVIFEVGGLGYRSLTYWEAYVLILLFSVLGVLSLRMALSPESRLVHRGPTGTAT
jgi:hypothetical protein